MTYIAEFFHAFSKMRACHTAPGLTRRSPRHGSADCCYLVLPSRQEGQGPAPGRKVPRDDARHLVSPLTLIAGRVARSTDDRLFPSL